MIPSPFYGDLYLEVFYNRQRYHSANSYLAPLAYEQALKIHGIRCPEK